MPHPLALAIEIVTTALALAGMGYFLAALLAARVYLFSRGKARAEAAHLAAEGFAPGVSILKSLKGLDPGILDAFRSHCRQNYHGQFEMLFGVSSLADPAVATVERLRQEFPEIPIRLVECPERLGANGKISTLVQLARHARHDFLLINDSDITVGPNYLARVMACFAPQPQNQSRRPLGLVTALYRGRAHGSVFRDGLPSHLESLGIATDFMPSVLLSRLLEGGLQYGLGSTLAVSRDAFTAAGGLMPLVDQLADDHELGVNIVRAGYRVEIASDVVETSVPLYGWRGFFDHQLRWMRTVRDARPWGYAGLIFTHGLGWALLNVVASGLSPVSLWLLALSFFLRLTLAMTAGAEVLSDRQVLPHLFLLPARDFVAMGLWATGFAGNTIVWRGERFMLRNGRLEPVRQLTVHSS
jgi:ceramide glucosyltransferase